jgi:transcriptional regulator with XRE-family HTH domain
MINARQIKDLLAARGWNQVKLANECNVTQATVSRWVGGTQQPDPPAVEILTRLINETPDMSESLNLTNAPELKALVAAVHGSYLMLGLDEAEADALMRIVLEVAEEPLTPSADENYHRIVAQREVRKFLKSIDFQHDGA